MRISFIRNKTLFQLGTILLELEFEDSLEAIIEKWNTAFPNAQDNMGSLTDRLLVPKRHAGENLGVECGRIVRMCLDCDFGLGLSEYSLRDEALQKTFYLQTVYQLEKMLPIWEKIYGAFGTWETRTSCFSILSSINSTIGRPIQGETHLNRQLMKGSLDAG